MIEFCSTKIQQYINKFFPAVCLRFVGGQSNNIFLKNVCMYVCMNALKSSRQSFLARNAVHIYVHTH
jgi:hypothetical protein